MLLIVRLIILSFLFVPPFFILLVLECHRHKMHRYDFKNLVNTVKFFTTGTVNLTVLVELTVKYTQYFTFNSILRSQGDLKQLSYK